MRSFHPAVFVLLLVAGIWFSCRSNLAYSGPTYVQEYAGSVGGWSSDFFRYSFDGSRILSEPLRQKWKLRSAPYLEYVLFAQLSRDFLAQRPGRERLYLVGRREVFTEEIFQTQQSAYDVLLLLEAREPGPPGGGLGPKLGMSLPWRSVSLRRVFGAQGADGNDSAANWATDLAPDLFRNFFLAVQDFDADGRDDLFFGFESSRKNRPLQYYLYGFTKQNGDTKDFLRPLIKPWSHFSREERQNGTAKRYSQFMREINADMYPAFVAEIELDLNYTINIDLSPMSDVLIREQVYDKNGAVRQKRGIPHLDFNPILLPVRHKSGRYMVRSVQQVRNRYGQIGIFVCNWLFLGQRWVPANMEFLAKPRV